VILVSILIFITVLSQEPTPPVFDNITVSCSISYDCPQNEACYYTYKYVKSNPATNTMTLDFIYIPLNDLTKDVILPQPIDFTKSTVAYSHHETYSIHYKNYMLTDNRLIPSGYRITIMALLRPGTTTFYPNEVPSYKPPTIKTLWINPFIRDVQDYIVALCNYRGIEPEQMPMDEAYEIREFLSFVKFLHLVPLLQR